MKKLMMAVVVAAGTASALAMPTKDELTKAQPLVTELMAPAMAKYKAAGYKEKAAAAAKVGDASSEFAKAAETEVAKFLLLKGAVNFYTRGEQYDKAADMIAELQREVKDVPPAVIAEITGKATGKISEAKAPKLYAIYRSAKLQVRAADEAKSLAAKLKKAKSDALQRKYAEALAVSGDWNAAYTEFAKVSDAKLKEIAAAEAAGNAKSAESGEFWWAYQPAFEDADDFFKSHAAAYYRKALDAGEITGLKKNLVEQRLEKSMSLGETGYKAPAEPDGLYCVIDLAGGPNAERYPVSYLDDVPKGGWTEEYKTTKLVLRKIEPGSFTMGDQVHGNKAFAPESCTLTKPYFIGVFEVTQRQWELVMGTKPSYFEADYLTRPVEQVSYMMIRGSVNGTKWPVSAAVDEGSFMGVLRKKANRNFDLPTDAQWEYACRAGTNTDFSNGKNLDSPDAASGVRHLNNSWDMVKWKYMNGIHNWKKCAKRSCDSSLCSAKVGSYAPNGNGLYDMHGNVRELCLDWDGERHGVEKDPLGPLTGSRRVSRGGCWRLGLETCTSFARWGIEDSSCEGETGFRLAIQPEFKSSSVDGASSSVEAKEDGVDEGREVTVVKTAEEGGAAWRYSFGVSNGNWAKSGFDDSGWQEGKGMFVDGGELMKDRRFTRVIRGQKTKWESEQIWLRQGFVFDGKSRQNISKVTLRYYVWGAAEFYLNGEKVATNAGGGDLGQIYSRGYVEIDITEQAKKLLKLGKGNVLAAHASNSSGGRSYWIRYIDAGLSITTK